MNPTILSIGNATKDVFLEIDQSAKVFQDDLNLFHYDLTFDDSKLEYSRKAGIFGGIILSEKIFQAAHLKSFSNINPRGLSNYDFENNRINFLDRYIVSHEGRSVVLANKSRKLEWVTPIFTPNIIYIAETNFRNSYLSMLRNYIKKHPEINLIFSLNDIPNDLAREILGRASLVFVDLNEPVFTDMIDYSSEETIVKSLISLGVKTVVIFRKDEIFAGNSEKISKITTNFKLNSFYQNQIFRAAFIGQELTSKNISDNLKIATIIATESNFNDILKPIYAKRIANWNKKYFVEESEDNIDTNEKMRTVAKRLVEKPKGIFAADESGGNIHAKFESVGVEDTFENRRKYREMLLTTPDIENYISGVILFEETAGQQLSNGDNFVKHLKNRGIYAGIKLDEGLVPLIGFDEETTSKGLDSLEYKLEKYSKQGLDFAKWRVAFKINKQKGYPSNAAIATNVQVLARFAKACQKWGIVPIVEPEILYDGSHSIKDCRMATGKVLLDLFEELKLFEVDLTATILKTNMILAGNKAIIQSSPNEVAAETVNVLQKCVPKDLAGVVFLSGGQSSDQATKNLQAISKKGDFNWGVTYSFSRAVQIPALQIWRGKNENSEKAQIEFFDRILANSNALHKD